MSFAETVVQRLLLKSGRHCCLCHKFKGTSIEIHHIDPELTESRDEIDNGIPLCFDCHAAVGNYNIRHPRGRRYRPSELRVLRDEWFDAFAVHGMQAGAVLTEQETPVSNVSQTVTGNGNLVAAGDLMVNSRKVVKISFSPGPNHIAEVTAVKIKQLIDELVELEKQTRKPSSNPYGKWWAGLQRRFEVTTYKAIPRDRGDDAITWLQKQKALMRPKLRRAAPETWRRELYIAIYARATQLGINKAALYEMAQSRLALRSRIVSLKNLGERDLKRLHEIVFAIPPTDSLVVPD